jgi:hypothetical protein
VNKVKQNIVKVLAIVLSCAPALALTQDVGSMGQQAQNLGGMGSLAGLVQNLKLTPQQLQQVLPILEKEVPQLQSIMGKSGLSNAQKTQQTKAVQKQSDSQLKSLLSPEQFTSLQNFRSEQLQGVLNGVVPQ